MTAPPVPYRVVLRHPETSDTTTLRLWPAGPEVLPAFTPGRFAMLYAFGVGEIPVSVSAIRAPGVEHTVRAVGATSGALRDLLPGDRVGLRGPFGTGWELERAAGHDVLVVAGGIGLAPLRPLVASALAESRSYGRINVLVGARTPGDVVFREQLRHWRRRRGLHVAVTVDRAGPDWRGNIGVVTSLLDGARFRPERTWAFVCGPEVMIRATAVDLMHRGVPAERIRVSLERNMRCATGHCGHCQLGPVLLCRDGPVLGYDRAEPLLNVREL
ncbi:FAD/NAD(P)-binding protein [Streptomyces sp. GC420]|uniref:FAD/NAD(P)-binding protein n=1 Tax=Streptomyces sp. GC420 TaxID=2697568 RepID=UPI001414EAC6|nr:FAD/NAD(P)-binding protein [Streptomyces sp. GC420]NBM17736.1 oxidoreductase [Streptomyces sp. GC420]